MGQNGSQTDCGRPSMGIECAALKGATCCTQDEQNICFDSWKAIISKMRECFHRRNDAQFNVRSDCLCSVRELWCGIQ